MNIKRIYDERFLLEKEYLGEDKAGNELTPLVSVCVITYQHKDFIRECIDGILQQEVDFDYEIIIGEDESTDGTREICKDYAERFPDKIRLFLRNRKTSQLFDDEGNYVTRFNGKWARESARGKYIALCEGDDYWTDSLKLQKQIDFLEKNEEYAATTHRFRRIIDDEFEELKPLVGGNQTLSVYDLVYNIPFQTATIIFRKKALLKSPSELIPFITDTTLFMLIAEQGNIYFINEYMSVYRIHRGGTWSELSLIGKIELREFYQLKRIEHFELTNTRVADGLKFKLAQDYIQTMARCFQRLQVTDAARCFLRSFKYSYGMAQVEKLLTIGKLIFKI